MFTRLNNSTQWIRILRFRKLGISESISLFVFSRSRALVATVSGFYGREPEQGARREILMLILLLSITITIIIITIIIHYSYY